MSKKIKISRDRHRNRLYRVNHFIEWYAVYRKISPDTYLTVGRRGGAQMTLGRRRRLSDSSWYGSKFGMTTASQKDIKEIVEWLKD